MSLERQEQLQKLKKEQLIELIGEYEETLGDQRRTNEASKKNITDLENNLGAARELSRKHQSKFDEVNMKIERIPSAIRIACVFYPAPEMKEDPENPGYFIEVEPQTNESKMLNQFLSVLGVG